MQSLHPTIYMKRETIKEAASHLKMEGMQSLHHLI